LGVLPAFVLFGDVLLGLLRWLVLVLVVFALVGVNAMMVEMFLTETHGLYTSGCSIVIWEKESLRPV
jgi:hypothetical protein